MLRQVTDCPNCKASYRYVRETLDPITNKSIAFCGRCHKVISIGNDLPIEGPEAHLHDFAKSFAQMAVNLSGMEVMAGVFFQGVKTGADMALSVPWTHKERIWMEKYGVVAAELIKELKEKLGRIMNMQKTASQEEIDARRKEVLSIQEKIKELEEEIKMTNQGNIPK